MGANVTGVQNDTVPLQGLLDPLLHRNGLVLGYQAATDTRLVAHHDELETTLPKVPQCLCSSWQKANFIRIAEIAGVFDEGTVPVEEHGTPVVRPANRLPGRCLIHLYLFPGFGPETR